VDVVNTSDKSALTEEEKSPCWFVNKNINYPFENVDMIRFFGDFNDYKPDIHVFSISGRDFRDIFMYFTVLPMMVEGLIFNPNFLSMVPFMIGNMLNGFVHIFYATDRFYGLMNDFIINDDHLIDTKDIKNYLTSVRKVRGKYDGVCYCTESSTILSRKYVNKFPIDPTEQEVKFDAITVPDNIKRNLHNKTVLSNRSYFYSASITIFLIYFTSVCFYKSFTACLNKKTLSRIGLTMFYNWYLLHTKMQHIKIC
jgi:hypothetical protein